LKRSGAASVKLRIQNEAHSNPAKTKTKISQQINLPVRKNQPRTAFSNRQA
jgi:hypothetical protein